MLSIHSFLGSRQVGGGSHVKRAAKRSRKEKNQVEDDDEPEVMPTKGTRRQRSEAAKAQAAKN